MTLFNFLTFLFFFTLNGVAKPLNNPRSKEVLKWIELKSPQSGFFSNLMLTLEWMYVVKKNRGLGLYISMEGLYGSDSNLFEQVFESIQDSAITFKDPKKIPFLKTAEFPLCIDLRFIPSSHIHGLVGFVYMKPELYKHPDFHLFRKRLYPIIHKYIRLKSFLKEKIDAQINQMREDTKINKTIGVHVRSAQHYMGLNLDNNFLDQIEKDIDEVMQNQDIEKTQLYVATLNANLIERLKRKYKIIYQKMPRFEDSIHQDWSLDVYHSPIELMSDVITDAWALSHCDEIHCGVGNITTFVSCLNPLLTIKLLKSLENCYGR